MTRFTDKVVLITGGARGQGRSHAVRFAREGANVAICDIARLAGDGAVSRGSGPSDLDESLRLIEAEGGRGLAVRADVREHVDMQAVVAQVLEAFGRIDVLVANAGICTSARSAG